MTLLVIFFAIIGAIVVKSATASSPSRIPASPNNPNAPKIPTQSPTFYQNPGVGGARQISSLTPPSDVLARFDQIRTIAKPQGAIIAYNPQTGTMTFVTQYANKAWGESASRNIAFNVDVQDGTNQASFQAGTEIDFLYLSGDGGTIIVKNDLPGMVTPSTNSPSDTLVPPSEGLSNGPSVLPSTDNLDAPYPAGTPDFVMPTPSQTGAMNPDNAIVSLV